MKLLLSLLLALVLSLTACGQPAGPDPEPVPDPPAPTEPSVPVEPEIPQEPEAMLLDRFSVELVANSTDVDRIMSSVRQLSDDLLHALKEKHCDIESVPITLSTAGGVTGDAVSAGGVDAAFLSGLNFMEREENLVPVLIAGQGEETWVAVLTSSREELQDGFAPLLADALLHTEPGQNFLSTYAPGITFSAVTDGALAELRTWYAEETKADAAP